MRALAEATAKARELAATDREQLKQKIRRHKLELLDSLPEPVRTALREARYTWPVEEIAGFIKRGSSVESVVQFIRTADEGLLKKRSRV